VNKINSYVWLFFKQICFNIPLNLLLFLAIWQILPIGVSLAEKAISDSSNPKNSTTASPTKRDKQPTETSNVGNSQIQPREQHLTPILKTGFFVPDLNFSTTGRPERQHSENLSPLIRQEHLNFSGTGRPGQRTSGGSRGQCRNDRFDLLALLPKSNWGKTFAERPTFWLYISSLPKSEILGELILQDENRNDLDRIPVRVARSTQLVGLKLPETSAPLAIDRWYRWYFKIACDSDRPSTPIFVQGWVKRVTLHPTTESELKKTNRQDIVYAQQNIWYDAVNYLAQLVLNNPQSSSIQKDWQKLLTAKGVDLHY
jgi:hypothetical protein